MMKPELQNWNTSGKPLHQKTLKYFNPTIFHIIIYDKNIGMLEMDDLDLWYYFMILYSDKILWWNLMMKLYDWIYLMMHDDEMMWDDDVWNYVVLLCVDTVMKGYEMLWTWTVVNDDMMEVDDMNLGVFVSSYTYIYIYIHT